jgi:hypothetical protein
MKHNLLSLAKKKKKEQKTHEDSKTKRCNLVTTGGE